MKKTIGLIIILIIMLITLTGCAEVNYELEINNDGTGKISCLYGISKEELGDKAELLQAVAMSMKEKIEENGYTVEMYEDDKVSGFKGSKILNDITTEFSVEEVFEVFENFGEKYVEDTEENRIKIETNLFKTVYLQKAVVDLSEIGTEINMEYSLKLPVKTKTNNATKISEDGKTLTWEIKTGEINNIEFVAEEINIMPIVVIVVAIVAAIVIVVTVIIIIKKKHATNKAK